jgi:hypothetical protein
MGACMGVSDEQEGVCMIVCVGGCAFKHLSSFPLLSLTLYPSSTPFLPYFPLTVPHKRYRSVPPHLLGTTSKRLWCTFYSVGRCVENGEANSAI